ncbi:MULTISPECIES: hypothetical protein [Bacillus]|nr:MULTISPECIES: hypothetical protein [Bacillus]MED3231507.1 hypothetical protein [Bacillus velezensis]MED3511825.1 hypothetical protein [Bacillus velezensis]
MKNRDLIKKLLEFDLDDIVVLSIGEEFARYFEVKQGFDEQIQLGE